MTLNMSSSVFGVCFGNSCASIAVYKDGKKHVLADDIGERYMPAYVTYLDHEMLVGLSSKQSLYRNASCTASCMATILGLKYDESTVQEVIKELPCKLTEVDGDLSYQFTIGGSVVLKRVYEPLLAIFKKLNETAKSFDPNSDMKAVVVTPVFYSYERNLIVRKCLCDAGFQVLRVISEPAAACLEYGIGQSDKEISSYVLVYSVGAWTLSVTLLRVVRGMYHIISSHTEYNIGGRLFDAAIADVLASEFQKQWKVDPRQNSRAMFKLFGASESAKQTLSTNSTASVHLESLHEGLDFQYTISRGRFEGMCSTLFRKCIEPVSSFLKTCKICLEQITNVVLTGGGCKIPLLQQLLKDELPLAQHHYSVSPNEVTVLGCVQEAAILANRNISEVDHLGQQGWLHCTPSDLWMYVSESSSLAHPVLLLPRLSPIPCWNSVALHLQKVANDSNNVSESILEIQEGEEVTDRRVIAKICVPMMQDKVNVDVSIAWEDISSVSVVASQQSPTSDWKCEIQLACET